MKELDFDEVGHSKCSLFGLSLPFDVLQSRQIPPVNLPVRPLRKPKN